MATKFFPSRQNWTFKFWTPKQHWTTIIDSSTSESKDVIEDFKHVPRFGKHKVQLLKQINEGAQGIIHTAQVSVHNNHLNEDEQIPIECVVKAFKGSRSYGQWPEEVFELSKLSQYICKFLGYCKDGDTFYLIMQRYDCSLRGAIDKVMMKRKGVAVFRVAFAIFYFLLVFYAPKILWHFDYISASALARVVSGWYFLPVYVILLLGGVAIIRLVFLSLIVYYYARPLADSTVLIMMIQIALGMQILHEKGIVHRDLKADNILVQYKHGQLIAAFIGDFDVGSKLVGTQFWRAPEILEALDKGEKMHHIQFNSTADVYSYAMTCYEILTGAIPLEGLRSSDYDAVISGKRPKLPTDLNPKLKSLIQRCWHQESAMRPTFCDIVTELEELVKELVTGSLDMSKMFNDMFDHAKIALDVERASAESSLVELKELLQVLVLKYDQADFLLLGLEVVAAMEEFQCRFGLRCFKEQHDLAYSEWFARRKLHSTILWKRGVFARISAYIVELGQISKLMEKIIDTINKDNCHEEDSYTDEASATEAEIERRKKEWAAYLLEIKVRMEKVPSFRHSRCVKKLVNPKFHDDKFQACDLCKFKSGAGDGANAKYCLYVRK